MNPVYEKAFGPFQKPTETTIPKFQQIQEKFHECAVLVDQLCPDSREKSLAMTELQSGKMFANAAIALHTPQ